MMTNQSDGRLSMAAAPADTATAGDDLDIEMTLLALAARGDMGGPMQDFDMNALSDTDKRMLLAMLRAHLGGGGGGAADGSDDEMISPESAAVAAGSGQQAL